MHIHELAKQHRKADYPAESIFLQRWSPRAMSGEPITDHELNVLLEAARWAPSSYNEQPWRFLYARRDTPQWQTFFDLLVEQNQAWCRNAAVLFCMISRQKFTRNDAPNPVHVFDCGSAWENLALQGAQLGLVVHGMAGFDQDKARRDLHVPEHYSVCAMAAIGRHGDPAELPEQLRKMDVPNGRKPIAEWAFEGPFPGE